MSNIFYVGQQVADDLKQKVSQHLDRYLEGDFLDLEAKGDWRIPLSLEIDSSFMASLCTEKAPESEIGNSLLVGSALAGLTPSLARENRLWIRLSHIEGLEYARARWLNVGMDEETLGKSILKHFFAPTLTACRDDHAVARLWWNHHVAEKIFPEEPIRALEIILAKADIRLNLIERPGIAARPDLARALVLFLESNPLLSGNALLFRNFMKAINLHGAGIAFEVWSPQRTHGFMERCLEYAQNDSDTSSIQKHPS